MTVQSMMELELNIPWMERMKLNCMELVRLMVHMKATSSVGTELKVLGMGMSSFELVRRGLVHKKAWLGRMERLHMMQRAGKMLRLIIWSVLME